MLICIFSLRSGPEIFAQPPLWKDEKRGREVFFLGQYSEPYLTAKVNRETQLAWLPLPKLDNPNDAGGCQSWSGLKRILLAEDSAQDVELRTAQRTVAGPTSVLLCLSLLIPTARFILRQIRDSILQIK